MIDKNVENYLNGMRINDGIVVTITNKKDFQLLDGIEFDNFEFRIVKNNITIKNIENVLHIKNIIKTTTSIGLIIIETEDKKIEIYEQ